MELYNIELFDSHAHYDDEKFNEDRDSVIKAVYESGVTKFISAGYSLESSKKAIEIANKYEYIYATCGISPNDIPEGEKSLETFRKQLIQLEKLAENKKVVITLVKSPIGGKENQKATLKALGLNKMHASVEKYETETIKGMINAVRHLVKVEDK